MNRTELLNLIDDNSIIHVSFEKKDGTIRELTGRLGVKKYVKGVGKRFSDEEKDLVTIFDMEIAKTNPNRAYRSFKVSKLRSLKHRGTTYEF